MKHILLFTEKINTDIQSLISLIDRDDSWVIVKGEGYVGYKLWRKELSKKGYYCLIRITSSNDILNAMYYLETKDEHSFMDYCIDPIMTRVSHINTKIPINKVLENCLESCEYQLDFYNQLEKMPSYEELQNCLVDFYDEGFTERIYHYSNSHHIYGFSTTIEKINSIYDEDFIFFRKDKYGFAKFYYAIILNIPYSDNNKIEDLFKSFAFLLSEHGDYIIKYKLLDSDHAKDSLIIFFKNK